MEPRPRITKRVPPFPSSFGFFLPGSAGDPGSGTLSTTPWCTIRVPTDTSGERQAVIYNAGNNAGLRPLARDLAGKQTNQTSNQRGTEGMAHEHRQPTGWGVPGCMEPFTTNSNLVRQAPRLYIALYKNTPTRLRNSTSNP